MTAAATRVPLNKPAQARKALGKRQEWQEEAWAYFDEVPELKYSTWFLGNAMAKLRLFVGVIPEGGDGDPIPVTDPKAAINPAVAAAAVAELARLRSALGGQGEILREANMNLEVAAECFLVGRAARDEVTDPHTGAVTSEAEPEEWDVKSVSEVVVKGSGSSQTYSVRSGPDDRDGVKLDITKDTIIRLYQRHPRWSAVADCAMRGVLGECEALMLLSRQIIAEAKSKASAGFFTLPNELDFGPADPTEGEDGDQVQADPFMEDMSTELSAPIEDPSHPASTVPMLIRGPGQWLTPDHLRHISLARESSKDLEARIQARVERLARGINLPVEVVLGHQQTTYANAEQVDQDTFDDHLQPRCVLLVDALTIGFLRPQLQDDSSAVKGQPDIERLCVWFDPAAMIRSPNTESNADAAFEKNAISAVAYRRVKGYDEDDAPTKQELLERTALERARSMIAPEVTTAILRLLGVPFTPEALPAAPGAAAPAIAASGRAKPARSQVGRQLMDIDRDLRTRLLVLTDAACTAALKKAGARLRSKSQGRRLGALDQVPATRLASVLGPDGLGALGVSPEDLLDGAFADLEAQFMAWGATAQRQALELASRTAGGFTAVEREALQLRQAADLTEAWGWLEQHLRGFAHAQLFDPSPAVPELGEIAEGLSIPPGMIRQALARAGGATLETTGIGGDVWVALHPDGSPLGGIGTGDLIDQALTDHGVGRDGYRWVYGPAARHRPFEPHVELDGVEFTNFDDDQLANTSGFPELPYYTPGDHGGCICDVEPIILGPEEA